MLAHLLQGFLQAGDREGVFCANVDHAMVRANGVRGDQHAFQQRVRVTFDEGAVHERAGVAFIGIAYQVLIFPGVGAAQFPLFGSGETASAAPAQA